MILFNAFVKCFCLWFFISTFFFNDYYCCYCNTDIRWSKTEKKKLCFIFLFLLSLYFVSLQWCYYWRKWMNKCSSSNNINNKNRSKVKKIAWQKKSQWREMGKIETNENIKKHCTKVKTSNLKSVCVQNALPLRECGEARGYLLYFEWNSVGIMEYKKRTQSMFCKKNMKTNEGNTKVQ